MAYLLLFVCVHVIKREWPRNSVFIGIFTCDNGGRVYWFYFLGQKVARRRYRDKLLGIICHHTLETQVIPYVCVCGYINVMFLTLSPANLASFSPSPFSLLS